MFILRLFDILKSKDGLSGKSTASILLQDIVELIAVTVFLLFQRLGKC
tara:strand:+ start:1348 stop:1491 length:144 start_codon:yes stop_codon:yes gene_type:complete